MKIERINSDEWLYSEEAYRIYEPCMYKPAYAKYRAKMQELLRDPTVDVYAYSDADGKAGMIAVKRIDDENTGIIGISVKKAFQRRGMGRYMVRYLLEETGCAKITVETDDDAVGFYRRVGFSVEKVVRHFADGDSVRYHCELKKNDCEGESI